MKSLNILKLIPFFTALSLTCGAGAFANNNVPGPAEIIPLMNHANTVVLEGAAAKQIYDNLDCRRFDNESSQFFAKFCNSGVSCVRQLPNGNETYSCTLVIHQDGSVSDSP